MPLNISETSTLQRTHLKLSGTKNKNKLSKRTNTWPHLHLFYPSIWICTWRIPCNPLSKRLFTRSPVVKKANTSGILRHFTGSDRRLQLEVWGYGSLFNKSQELMLQAKVEWKIPSNYPCESSSPSAKPTPSLCRSWCRVPSRRTTTPSRRFEKKLPTEMAKRESFWGPWLPNV